MSRPILLLIGLAFSIMFALFDTERVWGYPFSDTTHNAEAWVWFLCRDLFIVILAYNYWQLEYEFPKSATCFLILSIVYVVDYVLTCNEPWYPGLPKWATLNVAKFPIFGFVLVREVIKHKLR